MNVMRHIVATSLIFLIFLIQGCASKDIISLREQAYQAYNSNDYIKAAEKFEQLVQEVPRDSELWFRLGNAYARSEQLQLAVSAYQNALIRDPQLAKAWYNMGLIQLRTALKSFIEMGKYIKDDNPIRIQSDILRDGLITLLEHDDEKKH